MTTPNTSLPSSTTQKFYQAEADALFPAGCKCGNNGGGDCNWCGLYYYGPEHEGYDEGEVKRAFMQQAELKEAGTQ